MTSIPTIRNSRTAALVVLGMHVINREQGLDLSKIEREMDAVAVNAIRAPLHRPITRAQRKLFLFQRDEVLRQLETLGLKYLRHRSFLIRRASKRIARGEYLTKDHAILDAVFDVPMWNRETEKVMGPRLEKPMREGFEVGKLRADISGLRFSADTEGARRTMAQSLSNIKGVNDATASRLLTLTDQWQQSGDDISVLNRAIAETFERWAGTRISPGRAGRIGRTTSASQFEGGQLDAFVEGGIEEHEWLTMRDGLVRSGEFDHAGADGERVRVGTHFIRTGEPLLHPLDPSGSPANIIECFVGETLISERGASIKAAFRSRYQGEVVTIETAAGYQLTGTPNHPILTPKGFVALGLLNEGDEVLTAPLGKGVGCPSLVLQLSNVLHETVDVKDVPTRLDQLFDALTVSGDVVRKPRSAVNFYGDRPASKVKIVYANGLLRHRVKGIEQFKRLVLQTAHFAQGLFTGFRSLLVQFFPSLGRSEAACSVGGDVLMELFGLCHALPFFASGLGLRSKFDALFDESGLDGRSCSLIGFRQSIDRFPREVAAGNLFVGERASMTINNLNTSRDENASHIGFADVEPLCDVNVGLSSFVRADNVVRVDRIHDFDGLVYTLETASGIYNAGGIIAKNCRCTALPILT